MPLTLFACITFAIVSFPHVGENTFATATFALCISAIVIGLFRQIYINIVRKHYRVYFQYLSKKLSLIPLVIYTCIGCTLLYGQYLSPEARRTNIDKYLMAIEAQGSIFDECQFMIPLYLKNQLNSIGEVLASFDGLIETYSGMDKENTEETSQFQASVKELKSTVEYNRSNFEILAKRVHLCEIMLLVLVVLRFILYSCRGFVH